jgi:hypothetical protein
VIYEGKIMGEVQVCGTNKDDGLIETLGLMMMGTPLSELAKEGTGRNG